MKRFRANFRATVSAAVFGGILLGGSTAQAQPGTPGPVGEAAPNAIPPELSEVRVEEHLGYQIPLDTEFKDHTGQTVRLGQYFGSRPVLLNFVYYRCPMLCSLVQNATTDSLRNVDWTVGERFEVVTISIDERDQPQDASHKRTEVLQRYGREAAQRGWHFLTGTEQASERVARAVGFRYRWDSRQQQWAHPAAIFLISPDGKISRYLYGIHFEPGDVRFGLIEASEGRSVTTVEQLLMFCYHYDPQSRKYALLATRLMKVGGALTVLVFGTLLALLWRRERKKTDGNQTNQTKDGVLFLKDSNISGVAETPRVEGS